MTVHRADLNLGRHVVGCWLPVPAGAAAQMGSQKGKARLVDSNHRVAAGGRLKSARNDQGGVMGLHLGGVRGPKNGPDLKVRIYIRIYIVTIVV